MEEYTYTYDRAGNVTERTNVNHPALNDHFVYDAVNRLTEWDEGSPLVQQKTWSLDALGNDSTAGTYNAANEETPTQGSSAYDAAGNMTTLKSARRRSTTPGAGWWRWTAARQSGEVTNTTALAAASRFSGTYTAATAGTTVDDYYSGQQTVETRENSAVKYQYVWSPRYVERPISATRTAAGRSETAQRIFDPSDANYNVTAVVKENSVSGLWNVVERYSYTPYGVVTFRNADWSVAGSSANANTILYTGRVYDLLTSLYYYRARYYDPAMERFIGRDPIESDLNLYRYCYNDPTIYVDPSGFAEEKVGKITNVIFVKSNDSIPDLTPPISFRNPKRVDYDLNTLGPFVKATKPQGGNVHNVHWVIFVGENMNDVEITRYVTGTFVFNGRPLSTKESHVEPPEEGKFPVKKAVKNIDTAGLRHCPA